MLLVLVVLVALVSCSRHTQVFSFAHRWTRGELKPKFKEIRNSQKQRNPSFMYGTKKLICVQPTVSQANKIKEFVKKVEFWWEKKWAVDNIDILTPS